MKLAILALAMLLTVAAHAATSYTEFYVQTTGHNTNSGTTTSDTAVYSSIHGDWDGTSVFTVHDGSNPTVSVQTNTFAAVFVDGVSVPAFLGRIEGTNATTITLSTTAKVGTLAVQTGTATLTWGGAWKGPNAGVAFPFAVVGGVLTNAAQDVTRVNFKNNATYSITASINHGVVGPIRWQGYGSSVDDKGKAIIDGGSANIALLTFTSGATANDIVDFIFQNNATGTGAAFTESADGVNIVRCVAHDVRGIGFSIAGSGVILTECEAYNCNLANTATTGAFSGTALDFIRCVAHDNAQVNTSGFKITGAGVFDHCIADSNGADGFLIATTTAGRGAILRQCDAYNNVNGVDFTSTAITPINIENCNFATNSTAGINSTGSLLLRNGRIINCGFVGAAAPNGVDIAAIQGVYISGSITYPALPWVDAPNGNFSINLPQARGVGAGSFTQTQTSYGGTAGHPDIGAAQSRGGTGSIFVQ